MRLSDKRREKLFEAVSGPVTEFRVENQKRLLMSDEIDDKLFELELTIWTRVKDALGMGAWK